MSGSPIWHPFTQHALGEPIPLVTRGEGALLHTEDGRRVIDAISSWWVTTHGHNHPRIVAAIRDGMALAADWPTKAFDLREFYGPAAPAFDDHFTELKAAAKADPGDATLAFLVGYHLWFLGDKAEAEKLFRDAVKRVRDAALIDAFLKAKKP